MSATAGNILSAGCKIDSFSAQLIHGLLTFIVIEARVKKPKYTKLSDDYS